jgi:hypothetical protein
MEQQRLVPGLSVPTKHEVGGTTDENGSPADDFSGIRTPASHVDDGAKELSMKRQAQEQMLLDLKIERWPIERLIPFAKNSRTHSDTQVAQIAGSIAAFGFVNPVLVGPDQVIIAGHARLLAARKLALTEVPVIISRKSTTLEVS